MKNLIVLLLTSSSLWAQDLYVKTFGDPGLEPILYLHGGPGATALDFEITAAKDLSLKGFYVLLYDRRGEGRSTSDGAQYTFEQSFKDILGILDKYALSEVNLMGHSFGGVLGVKFARQYPERVKKLILVGAPMDMQATFKTILKNVEAKGDSLIHAQVRYVRSLDTTSIYYSSGTFMLAMQNGLYTSPTISEEGKRLHLNLAEKGKAYLEMQMAQNYKNMFAASTGFAENEKYTMISLWSELDLSLPIYGMYGKDDGLFDEDQLSKIQRYAKGGFVLWEDCSHSVFVDRKQDFLSQVQKWLIP